MGKVRAEDTISLASVKTVNDAAEYAKDRAIAAETAATIAEGKAAQAVRAASTAEGKAEEASTYANSALSQLGIVEDVIGVLTWASEHGSFTQTSDTSVQEGKVYFTYDSSTGDYTPVVTPASNPSAAGYYELTRVDEAMETFIMSHLAVTSRGLWVLPNGINTGSVTPASGEAEDDARARLGNKYKVLLSSDGMYIYDGSGALVSTYGESITFSANRAQYIGNNNAYIVFDPTGSGSLTIGGSSILFGSGTLEQALEAIQTFADSTDEDVNGTIYYQYTSEGTTYNVWAETNEEGTKYYYDDGSSTIEVDEEDLDKEGSELVTVRIGGAYQSIEGIIGDQKELSAKVLGLEEDRDEINEKVDGLKSAIVVDPDEPSITIRTEAEATTATKFTDSRIAFLKNDEEVLYIDSADEDGTIDIQNARIHDSIKMGLLEIFEYEDGIGVRRA